MYELPSRPSTLSLLNGPTPPLTPSTAQELFAPLHRSDSMATLSTRRTFGKLGDARSLARTDASEWPHDLVYNQPQSRAAPLPSASILDFAKVRDELKEEAAVKTRPKFSSPSPSRNSRDQSHDRAYEGKEWTVVDAYQGNGGLVNAMRSAAEAQDLDIEWTGTLGFPTDALSNTIKDHIQDQMLNDHASNVVYVTDKDFSGHYTHYCKTILWPIFHYQVPDHPKSKAYADHSWEFYRRVNQAVADKVIASYKDGDTIWVNDYHLLLVPKMIRDKLPGASIGFFLHTAFPSSEVFRCLAMREKLLEGMLGANLVAFQCEEYSQHFLQTCSRILTVETTKDGVQLENHFVNVTSEPIGINPLALNEARNDEDVKQCINALRENPNYKDKMLIVARDKLDNVHGVKQKLLAYELFMNLYPELAEKTVLIQVATSTSEQSELITTVSNIGARIASNYSTLLTQPLLFLKQDIAFAEYLALISMADVLMISSLRDGMNLTGHEYIYCQDGKVGGKKYGPLILSEFTGSAAVLHDQISINPWDHHQMARAIKTALEMEEAEKQRRWASLHSVVTTRTGALWVKYLSAALAKAHEEHKQRASTSVPRLSQVLVSEKYKRSRNRLFIIDYEGTIASHKTKDGIPLSSPTRVVDVMNDLMSDFRNTVYVMSGRRPEELHSVFRTATGLGLIAENGCFIRQYGEANDEWDHLVDQEQTAQWKEAVKRILEYHVERVDGSYIEERHTSVFFRYEKVEDEVAAQRAAGECADQISSGCKSMRIHAVPVQKAVLIEQVDLNKGTAATGVYTALREQSIRHDVDTPDFLMVAGDDREDEVVFRWANRLARDGEVRHVFTVSLGKRNTEAQSALTQGATGLLTVLQKLAQISMEAAPVDYFNSISMARNAARG
jgi:trehalose 6-phosphate synthase complex regulatory subunit